MVSQAAPLPGYQPGRAGRLASRRGVSSEGFLTLLTGGTPATVPPPCHPGGIGQTPCPRRLVLSPPAPLPSISIALQQLVAISRAMVTKSKVLILDANGEVITTEPGRTAWLCRCGQSQKKPFCDGSHKRAGFTDPGVQLADQ